jgi:hypothetical protein
VVSCQVEKLIGQAAIINNKLKEVILSIVAFFWAFVAANKLWPIKGKDGKIT